MNRLFLLAAVHNWGLSGPGDWEQAVWSVRNDASFELRVSFRPADGPVPDRIIRGSLGPGDLVELLRLVGDEWTDEQVEACDGTAWEFGLYRGDGERIKHRELGYIYGIEPYESIAGILRKTWED